MPPEVCPNCGAEVPPNARSCPECGADEGTGWSETAEADRLGLPDGKFDHHEFVKKEFGPARNRPYGIGWFWWGIALLLATAMLVFCLR
jgi:hypothetical protein